jgi:hypothetical protein
MTTQSTPTHTGITVSTAIIAGGIQFNHAEGIVVSTAITAGPGSGSGGVWLNHTEGVVVSTALSGGGWSLNHAETIV